MIFYNTSTNSAAFCALQWMSVPPSDETGRYDFWSRFLLLHSPFLFPPKKRGKRKGEWCSKNRALSSVLPPPPVVQKPDLWPLPTASPPCSDKDLTIHPRTLNLAWHWVLSLRISWGNIDLGLCNMTNYLIYVPKTEKVVTWPCLAKSENWTFSSLFNLAMVCV